MAKRGRGVAGRDETCVDRCMRSREKRQGGRGSIGVCGGGEGNGDRG